MFSFASLIKVDIEIKFKNLVVAHSFGGRVGVGGLWGGRSREEGDNVWLWLEEGERVVVAVG